MAGFQPSGRPTASLSSGLLARKGQARPAMRPTGVMAYAPSLDDLGWNDMGEDAAPRPLVSTSPAMTAEVPAVLRERETLATELAAPQPDAPVQIEPAPAPIPAPVAETQPAVPEPHSMSSATAQRLSRESKRKTAKGHKAAFTLRLDTSRHLRLRLASALRGDSAQQLVTEALDAFLNAIPEVEALASQLPTTVKSNSGGK